MVCIENGKLIVLRYVHLKYVYSESGYYGQNHGRTSKPLRAPSGCEVVQLFYFVRQVSLF